MKKFVMIMVVAIVTCFASLGWAATDGTLLDAEQKIAKVFFEALVGKTSYEKVEPLLTPVMKRRLNAKEFAGLGKSLEAVGTLTDYRFVLLEKRKDGDGVIYTAKGTKVPQVVITYFFLIAGEKPQLDQIKFESRNPEPKKEQAPKKGPAPQKEQNPTKK